MGFYSERIVPHLVNFACGTKEMGALRERACADLKGEVIEIGFGSGLNVPYYPADVATVAAVEPAKTAWQLARKRLQESSIPIQRSGLDGQSLPLTANSFDAALSTWTLCTIPDAIAALHEIRRVLKPGGRLHFLEHGLAPEEAVRRWQRRLEPLQRRAYAGCHLTRPIADLLVAAGFAITDIDTFYAEKTPKFGGWTFLGVAVSA